jgi:hypothetical protein
MDREVVIDVFQITVLNKSLGSTPGFVWQVGKKYKLNGKYFTCSRILHDDTSYYFNGQSRWDVYMSTDSGEEFKHVSYENASLEIKRSVPSEYL